jgi:hypothetical protein
MAGDGLRMLSGGKFGIRVKTGHKDTAEDLYVGKTTVCTVVSV